MEEFIMASAHSAPDDLQDARQLFTCAKALALYMGYGEDETLYRLFMQLAIKLSGDDYVNVAAGCGWTREELQDFVKQPLSPPAGGHERLNVSAPAR
jgi:hypothetical protein